MSKKSLKYINRFETLKNISENGAEFWFARDLQEVFEYSSWEKFENVITKATTACRQSGYDMKDHFHHMVKMVDIGSGARRHVKDYRLSRYACYLIVQNGDPIKPVIAHGQTYFAVQTRRKELEDQDEFKQFNEDQKRLFLRSELTTHNKNLATAAKDSGVVTAFDYAIFQNHGYKGLYGGLDSAAIHKQKKLKKNQKILDHMGSAELAANLFRTTQTEQKLVRDKIKNKKLANQIHQEIGAKVRSTIKELGGTLPENLPTPDKDIKQIEQEIKLTKKNKRLGKSEKQT